MSTASIHFVGTELYFDDLEQAKSFYVNNLGLLIADERPGHYAKFNCGAGFICLERKGSESYPSLDKAVLFFEVLDLQAAIDTIGPERLVQKETNWAALSMIRRAITFCYCRLASRQSDNAISTLL